MLLLLLVAACSHVDPAPQTGPVCVYPGVTFDGDFPAGRLNGCRRIGPDAFELAIRPEDRPINPSPWYAFSVTADGSRKLAVTLDYGDAEHRYAPKRLTPDGHWEALPAPKVSRDESRATFTLDVSPGATLVAGQPLVTPADSAEWARRTAEATVLSLRRLGTSAQGREILALEAPAGRETVVITGRQHPPEVTGALALRVFVARLMEDDELARLFRDEFGLLVIPMVNPDGVALGHWRHDAAGTDLNRDWGPFRSPETRLVRDALDGLVKAGRPPALVLDFHSTWRDVIYTQADDADIPRAGFPGAWHRAINARLDGPDIERSADHNPGRPTLKTWAFETYDVPAITYEMGDATPAPRIRAAARIAAEEMMRFLLMAPTGP